MRKPNSPKRLEKKISELSKLHKGTVFDLIGGKFIGVKKTRIEASFVLNRASQQFFGLMHGGIYAYVAESLSSLGGCLSLNSASDVCLGVEVNATHLRPLSGAGSEVFASASCIKAGKSMQVWTVEFKNTARQLLSIARCSVIIKQKMPSLGETAKGVVTKSKDS